MPSSLPRRQKLDALDLLAHGHNRDEVVKLIHLSKSTIARSKRKLHLFDDIEDGKKKRGPRSRFTDEMINVYIHHSMNKD